MYSVPIDLHREAICFVQQKLERNMSDEHAPANQAGEENEQQAIRKDVLSVSERWLGLVPVIDDRAFEFNCGMRKQ